jgi:HK97 family phage major capsid protein
MSQDYMKVLLEERNKANKAARDIVDAAIAEKRSLTAEDNEAIARADADFEAKNAMLNELRKIEAREAEVRAAVSEAPEVREQGEMRAPQTDEEIVRGLATGTIRSYEFRDVSKTSTGSPIPTSFYGQIQELLRSTGPVMAWGQIINTASGESLQFPRTGVYSTGSVTAEGVTYGESDPTFQAFLTLGAFKESVLFQITREMIEDSGVDILGYVATNIGQAIGYRTNRDLTVGTGTNEPTGVVAAAGTGVTSGTALTFGYADVVDLYYALDPAVRASNRFTFMGSTGAFKRLRKLVDTTGQPLWQPAVVLGEPDRILGKPIVENVHMADIGADAKALIAGDFNSYLIRQVGGLRVERSDDYAFNADLVTFKASLRVDAGLPQSAHIKYLRCAVN